MSCEPTLSGPPPLNVRDQIDELCGQYEQALQSPHPRHPEELLSLIEEAYRPLLLRELLTIEITSRRVRGQTVEPEQYRERFPEVFTHLSRLFTPHSAAAPQSTAPAIQSPISSHEPLPALPEYSFSGRQLGEGGMGVVWRARDQRLHRDVAVKVLRSALVTQSTIVRRFEEEAQLTSQLQHPGVPPVHESGRLPDGRPYFCMKIVKGETLGQLLRRRESPDEDLPRFLQIFDQICQAIGYAHSKGVVHRDLKPSNVMVGAFGEVQVMDWGLGKILSAVEHVPPPRDDDQTSLVSVVETDRVNAPERATQVGSVLGTYAYMPPEQAVGLVDQVDCRSDVFALGAILCEILTGQPPYKGTATEVKARAQLWDVGSAFERLRHCRADEALVNLARRCLGKERHERPNEGGEVAAAITAYQVEVQERLQRADIARATAEAESRRAAAEAREEQVLATARSEQRARRLGWSLAATLAVGLAGTLCFFLLALRNADHANAARMAAETASAHAEERRKEAVSLTEDLKRLTYAHQIGLAQAEWEANSARNAWDHLESTDPALRGWEYRYLRQLFDRNQMTIADQGIAIRAVAFHPDGRHFAAPGGNNTVKVWDASTGILMKSLPHSVQVHYVAFSPDGRFLASGGEDLLTVDQNGDEPRRGEVKVWDAEPFDEVQLFDIPADGVWCVAFDPESRFLAAATGRWGGSRPGEIIIWSTSNWQDTKSLLGHESWVAGLAFGPNGRLASAGGDGTIRIWDVVTGEQLDSPLRPTTLTDKSIIFNDGAIRVVRNVAFSPDGELVAAAYWDGTVALWEPVKRQLVHVFEGHTNCAHNVAFSPDGKRLASASWDGTVRLWDLETFAPTYTLKGHHGAVYGLAFRPDGRQLATGGGDATVKLWDLNASRETNPLIGHTEEITCLSFAPDSLLLASGSADGTVKIWNPVNGDLLRTLSETPYRVNRVAFAASQSMLAAAAGKTASIWDLSTGRRRLSLDGHDDLVTCLALSPDGRLLATGGRDRRVVIWDANTGQPLQTLSQFESPVHGLAFGPDNRQVASCGATTNVIISDVATGTSVRTLTGHQSAIDSVMFSPDGQRLASINPAEGVCIWDMSTGEIVRVITLPGTDTIAAALSADMQLLITADWQCSVKLWRVDVDSIQNVLILRGHTGPPHCLSLSPDGTRLASGGWDKTIRIWEAPALENP